MALFDILLEKHRQRLYFAQTRLALTTHGDPVYLATQKEISEYADATATFLQGRPGYGPLMWEFRRIAAAAAMECGDRRWVSELAVRTMRVALRAP